DQVEESKTHDRRACLIPSFLQNTRSTGTREVLERYTPTVRQAARIGMPRTGVRSQASITTYGEELRPPPAVVRK
ncbi:MAG: hypothetical protein M3460_30375, partial [Actinomycetota bacterium]|nr:hypothetical protein [Actinomycetota bacterium]